MKIPNITGSSFQGAFELFSGLLASLALQAVAILLLCCPSSIYKSHFWNTLSRSTRTHFVTAGLLPLVIDLPPVANERLSIYWSVRAAWIYMLWSASKNWLNGELLQASNFRNRKCVWEGFGHCEFWMQFFVRKWMIGMKLLGFCFEFIS